MRTTGPKSTLLPRIREYRELVEAGGEVKYPPSSFTVDCNLGDSCTGDAIRFHQTVNVDGGLPKTRTVAGRVIDVGCGPRWERSVTVETYWSRGYQPKGVMTTTTLTGSEMCGMMIMRQPWVDEGARRAVEEERRRRDGDPEHVNGCHENTREVPKQLHRLLVKKPKPTSESGRGSYHGELLVEETSNEGHGDTACSGVSEACRRCGFQILKTSQSNGQKRSANCLSQIGQCGRQRHTSALSPDAFPDLIMVDNFFGCNGQGTEGSSSYN